MTGPDGGPINISTTGHPGAAATGTQLYISGWRGNGAVILHRGPDYFSPDGEYCCGRILERDVSLIENQKICLTLSEYYKHMNEHELYTANLSHLNNYH